MIVHISLFYLKDKSDADKVAAALRRVPEQEKHIRTSFVGRNWFAPSGARCAGLCRRGAGHHLRQLGGRESLPGLPGTPHTAERNRCTD